MKHFALLVVVTIVLLPAAASSQIVPPAPGVDMPQAYYDVIAKDARAFQFEKAWFAKLERAKAARREIARIRDAGGSLAPVPEYLQRQSVVAGTVTVPVIVINYSNIAAPYAASVLDNQLFTSNPNGTMSQMYSEMSYGNLTLAGDVHGWIAAANTDTYYEGGTNGLTPFAAKTGELILEALQGVDASVDFGQYDNDGPDGAPNSGDDDGLVDFIAIVHPEVGGECSTSNMWSHRWVVGAWPAFGRVTSFGPPWTSNDARTGGGFIRVWDYTIQPAKGSVTGCGSGTIEIGVFCHEFGHAFGLPDLYDTNQGGQGIGEHGLMGSGNWQTPANPTHMSAWSKIQLGWISPTVVGPSGQPYTINNVEMNNQAFQLNVMEEKFARRNVDPMFGSWSLHCGLTTFAANNRNWPGGKGYGNNWNEAIRRDFSYDGSNPVTLQYSAAYDTEAGYDFAKVFIDVNGSVTELASYDGVGSDINRSIDLTPRLNGSGATQYQIIFQFSSDFTESDEDGSHNTGTAPFRVDNVSVTGGSESYATDFEQNEAGWYYDFTENPSREYFLVENHNASGAMFSQNMHGQGLFVWHVEENVNDNTSGSQTTANLRPAKVELRCADGLNELLLAVDRGDGGDVFPGTTNNTLFDNTTNPTSKSHNDFATNVIVGGISAPAAIMSATLQAGRFAPTVASITPASGEQGNVVTISDLAGTFFAKGATFLLRDASMNEYGASSVEWVGKNMLAGEIDLAGVPTGDYDVVVVGPDGQQAVLSDGFNVSDPTPVFIQLFAATVRDADVELTWDLYADEPITGFRILRRVHGEPTESEITPGNLLSGETRSFVDASVEAGLGYDYFLVVVLPDGSELRSTPATAQTNALALRLFQNYPNPFNPSTRIRYTLPQRAQVSLIVFDPMGHRVRALVDEERPQGAHEAVWNGRNDAGDPVASGVYFYQLIEGKNVLTRKLLLLK